MRPSGLSVILKFVFLSISWITFVQSSNRVTFGDDASSKVESIPIYDGHENLETQTNSRQLYNDTRTGKNLFDWIGLGTGNHVDPYLAKTNENCLKGDLAECFKSRALNYFSDFFDEAEYQVNENVKVIRMPRDVIDTVDRQPYEYSTSPRSGESEWDQLMKFAARKAEKFVKSVTFEVAIPSSEIGENEIYAPRFLDEIADEIDTLEDKKDTLFSRHQFRKLLIPMLIVLKLFKLKLLLFLPLIFGLVSFKKFLGFLAIAIPGLIGFFKLYRPAGFNNYQPIYNPSGIGYPHYKDNFDGPDTIDQGSYANENYHGNYHPDVSYGQDLAYKGYRKYHRP